MQETPVQFQGREDPLEKGMATHCSILGLPWCSVSKQSARSAGDLGSIPGLGRFPGGGHGNPLQYSCWRIPKDREVWQATVMASQRVGYDWVTKRMHTHTHTHTHRSYNTVVIQLLSHVQLFATPWTAAHQVSLSFTISWSWLQLMSIESVMPPTISSSVVPFSSCHQSLPASGSFPVSQLFATGGQQVATLVNRWPKYWSWANTKWGPHLWGAALLGSPWIAHPFYQKGARGWSRQDRRAQEGSAPGDYTAHSAKKDAWREGTHWQGALHPLRGLWLTV